MYAISDLIAQQEYEVIPDAEIAVEVITCPMCEGLGVIRYDVPTSDPRFGKLFKCPNPDCPIVASQLRQISDKLMKYWTWTDNYDQITFDSFTRLIRRPNDWTGKRGGYAAALMWATNQRRPFSLNAAAQSAWQQDWPQSKNALRESNCVVLTGDVGMGKTGLAVSAVNELRRLGQPVVFIRMLDLLSRIQETYKSGWDGASADDVLQTYVSVPFLVLDEFGVKNYRPDRLEKIESLIRERDRHGLPFLITTNLSSDECYAFWEKQIADIVAKAHWIEVGGVKLRNVSRGTEQW